jgi:hypothetical protein
MAKTRCAQCQNYAELKEPFHFKMDGYSETITVYGFCAKAAGPAVSTFYPVFLPDGGVCKSYIKKGG